MEVMTYHQLLPKSKLHATMSTLPSMPSWNGTSLSRDNLSSFHSRVIKDAGLLGRDTVLLDMWLLTF